MCLSALFIAAGANRDLAWWGALCTSPRYKLAHFSQRPSRSLEPRSQHENHSRTWVALSDDNLLNYIRANAAASATWSGCRSEAGWTESLCIWVQDG